MEAPKQYLNVEAEAPNQLEGPITGPGQPVRRRWALTCAVTALVLMAVAFGSFGGAAALKASFNKASTALEKAFVGGHAFNFPATQILRPGIGHRHALAEKKRNGRPPTSAIDGALTKEPRRVPWVSMQAGSWNTLSDRLVRQWTQRGTRSRMDRDAGDMEEKKDRKKILLMPGGVGLKSGVAVLPHPAKMDRKYELFPHCGGEDAYFFDDVAGVVGVADGVGGSASPNTDPGIYSRQLMNFAAEEVRLTAMYQFQDDPVEILQRAHKRTSARGSTTALILGFSQEPELGYVTIASGTWNVRVANLGDSGFVHLRSGEVLFQSTPLEHGSNHPFQLSADTYSDSASDAQNYELRDVLKGDVFVLGSDGLFDNAFSEEIADIVRREELKAWGGDLFAESAAYEVAMWAAQGVERDPDRVTPWAVKAEMEYDPPANFKHRYPGGKLDDITVVVVVVGAEVKPKETSGASMDTGDKVAAGL